MKQIFLAGAMALAAAGPVRAAGWQSMAQQCAEEITARYECGVSGNACWPWIYECTVARALPDAPHEAVIACEEEVNAKHPGSHQDPVRMGMECVMR